MRRVPVHLLLLLAILSLLTVTVHAEVFEWTDRDGTTHFTDDPANVPPQSRPKKVAESVPADPEPFQDGGISGIRVYGITITDQGIYAARGIGSYPARTISGEVKVGTDAQLVESTSIVNAEPGTIFGISYVVNGAPSDGRADITVTVISPPLRDPSTNEQATEQSWMASKALNEQTHDFYVFDKEWELVPGTWTMKISYRGKSLGSKSFEVRRGTNNLRPAMWMR